MLYHRVIAGLKRREKTPNNFAPATLQKAEEAMTGVAQVLTDFAAANIRLARVYMERGGSVILDDDGHIRVSAANPQTTFEMYGRAMLLFKTTKMVSFDNPHTVKAFFKASMSSAYKLPDYTPKVIEVCVHALTMAAKRVFQSNCLASWLEGFAAPS